MRELWLARNTAVEMVEERGYSSTQKTLTYNDFMSKYPMAQSNPSCLNFIVSKTAAKSPLALDSTGNCTVSLAVHFTSEDKLSKKGLETLVNEYSSQNTTCVILITFNKLNPACKALLKTVKLNFQHFMIEELQFNVTKHILVPKHRIMAEKDENELLSRLKCSKSNLPTILTTDVVARFYGAEVGQVMEITRPSQTTGTALYYRVVRQPSLK